MHNNLKFEALNLQNIYMSYALLILSFILIAMVLLRGSVYLLKILNLTFVLYSLYMYIYVKRRIDDSYTSYKSGVDYGFSNSEKSMARKELKNSIIKILFSSALLMVIFYISGYVISLVVCFVINTLIFIQNKFFVSAVRSELPKKPEKIPRSKYFLKNYVHIYIRIYLLYF